MNRNIEELFTAETQRTQRNPTLTPSASLRTGPALSLRARKKRSRLWNLVLVLGLALMFSACDKMPQAITDPTTTAAFSGSNPGTNSVYMVQNTSLSSGDTLAVDVKANNISGNVKGAAFDVDFDSAKITYLDKAGGDFFGAGSATEAKLQHGSTNKIVVGVTTTSGTATTNSGTIVTLKFKVTGNSSIAFSNSELRDSNNQAISGITWNGGSVTVQ